MSKADVNLNPVSYVVLGLISRDGASTPYDLKVAVTRGIATFWLFPHSQLYAEAERLARAGLLQEKQEQQGRRRRTYKLTEAGRRALREWLDDPTVDEPLQMRDLGLLKLYFGHFADAKDIAALAAEQLALHKRRLEDFKTRETRLLDQEGRESQLAVLRLGIDLTRTYIASWKRIQEDPPRANGARRRKA